MKSTIKKCCKTFSLNVECIFKFFRFQSCFVTLRNSDSVINVVFPEPISKKILVNVVCERNKKKKLKKTNNIKNNFAALKIENVCWIHNYLYRQQQSKQN